MPESEFTEFKGFAELFKAILLILLISGTSFAQNKVAILGTEDDGEPPLKHQELATLTAKLRDIAKRTLPAASYEIMTEQSIMSFLGSGKEMEKVCRAADGCLAKIGRDIQADYIGQARIARFGKLFTIKMEVYDVVRGTLAGTFTDETSEDMYALIAVIDNKAPDMFSEIYSEQSAAQALKESEKGERKETSIDPQIKKEVGSKVPFWVAVALEAVGTGLIIYGLAQNSEVASLQKDYDAYGKNQQADIDATRNKMEDAKSLRNIMYISGGAAITLGIGVHVWF